MQVFAYEEAVRHYELALTALEHQPDRDKRRHELLLALGEAQVKAGDAAMRMLMSGRYTDAEAESRAAVELGHRLGDPNAHQAYTLQMIVLRRDRGGLSALEEDVRINLQRYPTIPGWRCVLAHMLLELGDRDEACRELEALSDRSFAAISRDGLWLAAVAHLAEVTVSVGAVKHAAELYDLLAPFAARNVVVGWAATCLGSVARLLAMLASLLDREEEAKCHFERALAMNESMGAEPWATRTRVEYARFLIASGHGTSSAHALLERALADAQRLGMRHVLKQGRG